jgi:nucleotide-binding universal stress UspA family protein
MKWVVGLDLRPSSYGALHFASWLASTSVAGAGEQFIGVQVLEQEHLRAELRLRHLDEVMAEVRKAARDVLAREGAAGLIRDVEVLQASYADEGLEAAREHHGAAAVVIGRAASRSGARIIRLGRVARRMLRRVWSPIIVVPPDMRERDMGEGPVVALTDLGVRSAAACRFASGLAHALGRSLELLVDAPSAIAMDGPARRAPAPAGSGDLLVDLASRGLRPATVAALDGHVVERAIELAGAHRAALLVVEGHRPSTLERVLRRNTFAALAATAPLPVAVVPSP